jgi:hypothetical protein
VAGEKGWGLIFISLQKSSLFGRVFGNTKLPAIVIDNRLNTYDTVLGSYYGSE